MAFSELWPSSGCSFCASLARRSCWHAIWRATRNISRRCVTGWYHTSGDHPVNGFPLSIRQVWAVSTSPTVRRGFLGYLKLHTSARIPIPDAVYRRIALDALATWVGVAGGYRLLLSFIT